jgi:serine protease
MGQGGAAVLDGLRTTPVEPFEIDTTGLTETLPEYWATDPATGAQYRRDEVLVRFRDGASPALRARALAAVRGREVPRVLPGSWELLAVESGLDARQAAAALAADQAVEEVALNYRATAFQMRPNDQYFDLQWNFEAIDLPRAWEINPGATTDVVVAVIDTGLNVTSDTFVFSGLLGRFAIPFARVPDLVEDGRIVAPYDFVYRDNIPLDLDGHGTHVAGTIGQLTHNVQGVAGIAYNVKLMPLKVLLGWDVVLAAGIRAEGYSIIAEAIRYAADSGAQVINLSLGGPGPGPGLRDAIRYAVDHGAFVAIAAGNDGDGDNRVEYPAAYGAEIDGAMTVGAVDRDGRRARYSGHRAYVEICAPGGTIERENDYERGITQIGYNRAATFPSSTPIQKLLLLRLGFRPRFDRFELVPLQGTSMATPHISGVAALLYSQGIRDPRAIEEAITRFARPISATAEECGAGLVDPRRALRGLGLAR